MAGHLVERIGFELPDTCAERPRCRIAPLELITSTALAVSTVVVATMVTIGTARAAGIVDSVDAGGALLQAAGIAAALVVVLSGYIALGWQRGDASQN